MSDDRNDEAATFEQHSMTGMSEIVSEDTFAGDSPQKRNKPHRGRPSADDIRRRKQRERTARFRAKQTSGREKQWQQNLAELSPTDRANLLAQQLECGVLNELMGDVVTAVDKDQFPEDLFPDLVYLRIQDFLARQPLVRWWIPFSLANQLDQRDWAECDDKEFARYGLRVSLVKLFYRLFVCSVWEWAEKNPDSIDPKVHAAITLELAVLNPPKESRFVPEPVVFQSEKEREQAIATKEMVEAQQARFNSEFIKWKLGQINQENSNV
jgi:hypothetical protein